MMANKIKIDKVKELYEFLQGVIPDGITVHKKPNLDMNSAFTIIWYLQEHMNIIPDNYEKCDNCHCIFDTMEEGIHEEETGKNICSSCM